MLVLDPSLLVDQVHLGTAPTWSRADLRAVGLDGRLHGHRDRLQHGRGGPRPGRATCPRRSTSSLIAVLGIYAGISVVALSALPVTHDATATTRPRSARPTRTTRCSASSPRFTCTAAPATARAYYVGVLAATILFIATNAGLIGISRLSWSLAEHRQLPGDLRPAAPALPHAVVHDRLLLGPRRAAADPRARPTSSATSTAFGAMLSFTTAHVAIVALRIKEPDRERPYRTPWNVRLRGRDIPLTAVLGALGTVRRLGLGRRRCTPRRARSASPGWSVGLAGYLLYRRRHRARPARAAARLGAPGSGRSASSSSPTTRRWCRSSATDVERRALRARGAARRARTRRSTPSTCSRCRRSCRSTPGCDEEEDRGALRARGRAAGAAAARGLDVRTHLIRTRNPGAGASSTRRAAARRPDLPRRGAPALAGRDGRLPAGQPSLPGDRRDRAAQRTCARSGDVDRRVHRRLL